VSAETFFPLEQIAAVIVALSISLRFNFHGLRDALRGAVTDDASKHVPH
jgi:hypothetical protein